jgi:threonine/homoserine/homoserine lactone efflux protein
VAIIAVVVMLATPNGRVNGPAFLGGWVAGIVTLGGVVLVVASGASTSKHGRQATWATVVEVVLGVLLMVVGVRQWRRRPRGDRDQELPAWMKTIDQFTAARSAAMGAALSAVNPKNLLLVVSAAAAIAQTGASALDQAVALAVFSAISTIGVGAPVAIYFLVGDRATVSLNKVHGWMARQSALIVAIVCLGVGVTLLLEAFSALSS